MKPLLFYFKLYSLLFIIFGLLILGCDNILEDPPQEQGFETKSASLIEHSLTYYENKPFSELPVVQIAEQLENELSEIYSGFSGIWIEPESDEMILSFVEEEGFSTQQEAILSDLESHIMQRMEPLPITMPDYSFRTETSSLTFRELQYTRDLLTPVIHKRDDVVESYINVEKNVFSIGVLDSADKEVYAELLKKYSIDEESVLIYETSPVELASYEIRKEMFYRNTPTLQDRNRPLRGGLSISSSNGICTYGFNIKMDGIDKWVTNSHCTDSFSQTGSTSFYQNTSPVSTNFVGNEYRDFEGGGNVRFSDAAIIDHSGSEPVGFGEILLTEYPGILWGDHGSIDLVPHQGDFARADIVIELEDEIPLMQGMLIHKVGRRTGWTLGYVNRTCSNISNISGLSGWTLACQIRSNVYSRGGDSGSPVFFINMDTPIDFVEPAALLGLHWGRSSGPLQTRGYHSRLPGIRTDLLQSGETMLTY